MIPKKSQNVGDRALRDKSPELAARSMCSRAPRNLKIRSSKHFPGYRDTALFSQKFRDGWHATCHWACRQAVRAACVIGYLHHVTQSNSSVHVCCSECHCNIAIIGYVAYTAGINLFLWVIMPGPKIAKMCPLCQVWAKRFAHPMKEHS